MIHTYFNLQAWIQKAPLTKLRAQAHKTARQHRRDDEDDASVEAFARRLYPGADTIVGPIDIATVEQLRAEILAGKALAGVPADIFIWALGDAPDPRMTKVGGIPWMHAKTPWPLSQSGQPMQFLGQICFADSLDLAPPLPDPVLLLFREPNADVDAAAYRALWSSLHISNPLRKLPAKVPPAPHPFLYAQRHRTVRYLKKEKIFHKSDVQNSYLLPRLQATAIGPSPFWIQQETEYIDAATREPYTCIATFSTIEPRTYRQAPFINTTPKTTPHRDACEWPEFGDGGCLYIYLGPDKRKVTFDVQCG